MYQKWHHICQKFDRVYVVGDLQLLCPVDWSHTLIRLAWTAHTIVLTEMGITIGGMGQTLSIYHWMDQSMLEKGPNGSNNKINK